MCTSGTRPTALHPYEAAVRRAGRVYGTLVGLDTACTPYEAVDDRRAAFLGRTCLARATRWSRSVPVVLTSLGWPPWSQIWERSMSILTATPLPCHVAASARTPVHSPTVSWMTMILTRQRPIHPCIRRLRTDAHSMSRTANLTAALSTILLAIPSPSRGSVKARAMAASVVEWPARRNRQPIPNGLDRNFSERDVALKVVAIGSKESQSLPCGVRSAGPCPVASRRSWRKPRSEKSDD